MPMQKIIVHPRVAQRHPEISEQDVVTAWRNAVALQNRTYEQPDIYAAAGADGKGRMLELLAAELDDGSLLIYHAMKLTRKMRKELGLT